MSTAAVINAPLRLFISYAHQDEALIKLLRKHLAGLERRGLIASWYDRDIGAGEPWDEAIKGELEGANLILFCVSADFIASDYVHEVELSRALERHRAGEARVAPLLLRPCHIDGTPLAGFQQIPARGGAITRWDNLDEAFTQAAKEIEQLTTRPLKPPPDPSVPGRRRSWWPPVTLLCTVLAIAAATWLLPPNHWLGEAEKSYEKRHWSEAQANAERALAWGGERWPEAARAHWLAGLAAENQQDLDAAERHYEWATELDREEPNHILSLITLQEARGGTSEMWAMELEVVVSDQPRLFDAALLLATLLRQQGELELAGFYLRQMKIDEGSAWQLERNRAGWYYTTTQGPIHFDTRPAKEAMIHAERSLTHFLAGEPAESEGAFTAAGPEESGVDALIFEHNVKALLAWRIHQLKARQPDWSERLEEFRRRFDIPHWP